MNPNLILATGLAYGVLGALVLFASHRSVYRTATELVAGYPRVLAKLRLRRIDGRFGLAILAAGIVLQALAASGYSVSPGEWRYAATGTSAILLAYALWRFFAGRQASASRVPATEQRQLGKRVYETRRSFRLRQAAVAEAPKLRALERSLERRLGRFA